MLKRVLLIPLFLSFSLLGAACGGGSDGSEGGDGDGDAGGDRDGASEFCNEFCNTGSADIEAVECPNEEPITPEDIEECIDQCELQLSVPDCGELSQTFWQCTLDEYPALYECSDEGTVSQPDACSAEQEAVIACFNQ